MKLFSLLLVVLLLTACANKKQIDKNSQLAGMYKLLIIENKDSSGVWREQEWAKGGDGYIVYDGKGHMAVQITPKGYKDFPWLNEEETINGNTLKQKIDSMTVPALKAALTEFASNYVYVADYTIGDSADIIQHNRLSHTIPSAWNTSVKRKFIFSGDTLILEPVNLNRRLKWIKQK
ncbi:MAG TPA: lipocalin-like domain-containing protein [Chitinophagaceae bacterium]|nr:lipocalin-like domain-containing protein [Chitinophagaceae bacterium]